MIIATVGTQCIPRHLIFIRATGNNLFRRNFTVAAHQADMGEKRKSAAHDNQHCHHQTGCNIFESFYHQDKITFFTSE